MVRELVTKFTESNATVQKTQANLTSQFLGDEMKQAKDRVDTLEQALMKFKMENMGRLPEQFQANVAQLNTYQMMVSQANEGLSRLQQQKLQIETQLQNNNTNLNYYNSILEDQVAVGGQAQVRNETLNQLNQRIMNLQSEIAALTEQLTPNHPTIKARLGSLAALEKRRQEAEKEDLERQAAAPAAGPTIKRIPNQQAFKAVQDLTASNNVLKTEMQNLNLQMDEKVKQMQELNRMIASYQSRVEGSPQLEGQYLGLTRDLAIAKQSYEDFQRKSQVSDTAKNLEDRRAGENLEVLDPASDPESPSEPNRPQMGGHGHRNRPDARHRAGRRQGDEGYLPEEFEGRPRLYQSARAEQHPAAGKRAAGAPQTAYFVAGLVQRDYYRVHRDERRGLLLQLWPRHIEMIGIAKRAAQGRIHE